MNNLHQCGEMFNDNAYDRNLSSLDREKPIVSGMRHVVASPIEIETEYVAMRGRPPNGLTRDTASKFPNRNRDSSRATNGVSLAGTTPQHQRLPIVDNPRHCNANHARKQYWGGGCQHICCANCGQIGHMSAQCRLPIISFGIILFRIRSNFHEFSEKTSGEVVLKHPVRNLLKWTEQSSENLESVRYTEPHYFTGKQIKSAAQWRSSEESADRRCREADDEQKLKSEETRDKMDCATKIEYLLVRRKDSMNYVEFVRGKYDNNDIRFLVQAVSEMTIHERWKLSNCSFMNLWRQLWMRPDDSGLFNMDFHHADAKFTCLKKGYKTIDGIEINLHKLMASTESLYPVPEWGFPKGKRDRKESEIDCATRELFEETRCPPHCFDVVNGGQPIFELFKGSNNVMYKHVYFLGHLKNSEDGASHIGLKLNDDSQASEIGDVNWFDLQRCEKLFRPYDVEKLALIRAVDRHIRREMIV